MPRPPSARHPLPILLLSCLAWTWTTACEPAPPSGGDAAEAERAERPPKVLVIGIDGVRPDVLAEVPTPNLDALAADGLLIDDARTGEPTVSGPGWSSLLIGVWPDKHGVTDNDFTGERYGVHADFLTRAERARPELVTFAVADWRPLVASDAGRPPISDEIDVKHVLDGYELGWAEADERSVELAEEHLRGTAADASFVYLGTPDEVSHGTRDIGPEYREAIAEADRHVGRLIAAVRGRPTYEEEDWLVLVSTDHGRREDGGHGGLSPEERTIFVLVSGTAVERAAPPDPVRIVDVPVTALAHLGVELDPDWELDGVPVGIGR